VERREFLESSALGLGGLAIAGAMVASAPAEAAATQTKAASAPAEAAGASTQNKAIDTIREWDPAKAEAYMRVNTNPWKNGVLDIKTIELICVGLNAACTNLQPEPTRRHIRAALQAGATRNEIQLVIEGAAFMAIHACSLGAPILLEEGKAAGKTPTVKKVATPSADMMKAKGLWNTAWDPFFGLDPLWTDQFFAAVGGIYDGKTLQPKFVELLSIALDASVTHMYAPGTRRHIKGALALGATMEEIMETLKIATSFGQETINMAIPILAEEIAAFEKRK
jgi:alkylhydroperoxidase/carboxymuconolactone decarboxylase family protein YurZ